jgi:hypothetical protein
MVTISVGAENYNSREMDRRFSTKETMTRCLFSNFALNAFENCRKYESACVYIRIEEAVFMLRVCLYD